MTIGWVSTFLDSPPERAEASEQFWLGVTGSQPTCTSTGGFTFCLVDHQARRRTPPVEGPTGRSLVDQVCLDIPPRRYDVECAFWSALTGWPVVGAGGREFRRLDRPDSIPFAVLLQRLDDDRPTVTAHLDVACEDREAESSRRTSCAGGVRPSRARPRRPARHAPGADPMSSGRRPGLPA